MATLVLKFGNSVLQEVAVGSREVSIGRSPDNGLVIDNPAVSHYHARVFREEDRLMLEDFGSLNGTFVNGQRVKMVTLQPGDAVAIGKHTIEVSDAGKEALATNLGEAKPAAPKINETVMLNTKARRDFLEKVAAVGESAQVAPARLKVPSLVVRKGKTDRREYTLSDKLTVIGKSAMASVKLTGWFAPKMAAQVSRRDDQTYYLSAGDKVPSVNNWPISQPKKLSPGDVITIAGVELEFVYRD